MEPVQNLIVLNTESTLALQDGLNAALTLAAMGQPTALLLLRGCAALLSNLSAELSDKFSFCDSLDVKLYTSEDANLYTASHLPIESLTAQGTMNLIRQARHCLQL